MAEMTVEEARREVAGHLAEHCRPDSWPQAKCCLPVIDAYAVAVLEEAGRWIENDAVIEDIRTRISLQGRQT